VLTRRQFLAGGIGLVASLAGADVLAARLLRGYAGAPFVPAGLARYRSAVAAINTAPVDIVCVGDSITEAYYATTLGARWVEQLLADLQTKYGQPGTNVSIYRPGSWGTPGAPPLMALPWTITAPFPNTSYGLGRKNNVVSAGASMSISATCTGFSIVYAKGPAGLTFGSFYYAVDGGTPVPVSAVNASIVGGNLATVTGLSAASHTVAITPNTDHVPIEGIIFYSGNETSGIRVWEGGHSGYETSDYIDGTYPHWIDLVTTLTPALVIIELGRNEWVNGVSAATLVANLTTLVANIRAACTPSPSIMLVAEMQGNYTPGPLWSSYVSAIAAYVAADGNLAYVDTVPTFGGYTVPPSGPLYYSDESHPNDAGHAAIATLIAAAL
jgi:lysophospholipase L1-like esterase